MARINQSVCSPEIQDRCPIWLYVSDFTKANVVMKIVVAGIIWLLATNDNGIYNFYWQRTE